MLQKLCPPALIYLIFSITQITIDVFKRDYNVALVKMAVAFIFTILLNYLCSAGLGIVSWIIVFIPFILMSVIVSYILTFFGLDPKTKKIRILQDGEQLIHREEKEEEKREDLTAPVLSNISATYSEPDNRIVINYTSSKHGRAWCKSINKKDKRIPTIAEIKEEQSQTMLLGDDNFAYIDDYLDGESYDVYIYAEDNASNGMSKKDFIATKQTVNTDSESGSSNVMGFQNIKQAVGNFFSSNSEKYKERKRHVSHIEKILNELNENDNVAYFLSQSEACLNKKKDTEYEKCLKRVIQEVYARINSTESKERFIDKLHNSKINVIGITNTLI